MSQEEPPSRKEKKAQRDAERKKTGKKRKREDAEEPVEAQREDELEKDIIPLDAATDEKANGDAVKKSTGPKSRKRKVQQTDDGAETVAGVQANDTAASTSKKRKKDNTDSATQHRFILFVGNLPYSATDATIHEHFKKLTPFTLRHRTDPTTSKSKGFAFLEFENYDRMKTCLKLYHHSTFDPNAKTTEGDAVVTAKPSKTARRINVELTAGGGGKTDARKEKIKAKNVRLDEQRQRRAEQERKDSAKKERKNGKDFKAHANGGVPSGGKQAEVVDHAGGEGAAGMHPSRLARLKE